MKKALVLWSLLLVLAAGAGAAGGLRQSGGG